MYVIDSGHKFDFEKLHNLQPTLCLEVAKFQVTSTFSFAVKCYHITAKENVLEMYVLFWIMQNFQSNSRPLNKGLEKNA